MSGSSSLYCLDLPSILLCLDDNLDRLVQRESKDPPSPNATDGDGSYCKGAGELMETESQLSPKDKQEKKVRGNACLLTHFSFEFVLLWWLFRHLRRRRKATLPTRFPISYCALRQSI